MKKLVTTAAALAFVGSVSASNKAFIYHGFDKNNPDLYAGYTSGESVSAVQPGIGDNFDRSAWASLESNDSYGTFVMDNPDNYSGSSRSDVDTAVNPGIGDSSVLMQGGSSLGRTSYDLWVSGNPDQDSES